MKLRKKSAAGLAGLLISAFALSACGGSATPAAATPAETATEAASGSEASAAPATSETPDASANGLPIVTEPVTLSMWVAMSPTVSQVIQDFNENEVYQELEKRTGVHIEFIQPPATETQQSLNVLIASDNYPDILHLQPFNNLSYPGGTNKGIEDGVILNVNELVDQFMPNMKALMADGDDIGKAVYTDEGNIAGFYNIMPVQQPPWYGLVLRQDWLDELGLETPVTYDDWYEMLTAFKEQKNVEAPAMLYYPGMHQYDLWNAGYGIGTEFYHVDNVVKFGPIEDGYREYLEMIAKWYDEDLIDPDFPTRVNDSYAPETHTATGLTGAWFDMYTNIGNLTTKGKVTEPNYRAVAVANPVKAKGDTLHLGQLNARPGRNMHVITTNCENPEVAVKWFDYQYGEEGGLLVNYGIEGRTFEYGENGEPVLNEFITNNPDGLSIAQTMGVYLKPPGNGGSMYSWQRELANMPQDGLDALDIWKSNTDFSYHIPGHAVLTAEEGDEYSLIYSDIKTYVDEMRLKFILGQEPLTNFDAYRDQIKSMNIDRAIELRQASLDRYSNR